MTTAEDCATKWVGGFCTELSKSTMLKGSKMTLMPESENVKMRYTICEPGRKGPLMRGAIKTPMPTEARKKTSDEEEEEKDAKEKAGVEEPNDQSKALMW